MNNNYGKVVTAKDGARVVVDKKMPNNDSFCATQKFNV